MVAIITSTLIPSSNVYSYFSVEDRMQQTIKTIEGVLAAGFESVYLFDNSNEMIKKETFYTIFSERLIIIHQKQYAFKNKGINEALLLLNNIHRLPKNKNIFKISGRYSLSEGFDFKSIKEKLERNDFVGKGYNFDKAQGTISTRGYFVKNAEVYERILVKTVEEIYAYGSRIHGLRSAAKSIQYAFSDPLGSLFQISMEHAFARVLKKNHSVSLLNKLNIAGYVAGSDHLELIEE